MNRRFFTWNIHYGCNYSCTYCHAPKEKDNPAVYIDPERWIKVWKDIEKQYGETEILISGGEPSTYPGFFDMLKIVSELHIVELCTNLSWDVSSFLSAFDNKRIRVGTSFHPEFTDIDSFCDKLNILHEHGFETFVNFVLWPPLLSDLERYRKKAVKAGSRFLFQPFRGTFEGEKYPEGYSKDELAFLDDQASSDETNRALIRFFMNIENKKDNRRTISPRGKICYMGMFYGYILPDAVVQRCCSHESGAVGNMLGNDFSMLKEPAECVSSHCHCEKRMVAGEEENWTNGRWGR